ncbi:MAG: hypothetical protein WCW27_06460, partial [Patescibacteria group bacterium]
GIIATVLIMAGGVMWLTSAGNEQSITQGKELITSAVIGLVLALFSYSILYLINPNFVNMKLAVLKIVPKSEDAYCDTPVPTPIVTIPNTAGLIGNGLQACKSVADGLEEITDAMRNGAGYGQAALCPTCKIGVGSAYRSHESQVKLRDCYLKAKAEGCTAGVGCCTTDCRTCNPASAVCTSKHESGVALDLWLEGAPSAGFSSKDYRAAMYNNGGPGGSGNPDKEDLKANQDMLKKIMEQLSGGKFVRDSGEWWHFNYLQRCGDNYVGATNKMNKCVLLNPAYKRSDMPERVSANYYCLNSANRDTTFATCTTNSTVDKCPNGYDKYEELGCKNADQGCGFSRGIPDENKLYTEPYCSDYNTANSADDCT